MASVCPMGVSSHSVGSPIYGTHGAPTTRGRGWGLLGQPQGAAAWCAYPHSLEPENIERRISVIWPCMHQGKRSLCIVEDEHAVHQRRTPHLSNHILEDEN